MMRSKEDLYVVYEGLTEELFLKWLKDIYQTNYNLILKNANGKDKIVKTYLKIKKINRYANVVVMFDLDNKDSINSLFKRFPVSTISKSNIYYINPSFELLFILCKHKTSSKNLLKEIEHIFEIDGYRKTTIQIKHILNKLSKDSFIYMINNLEKKNNSEITNYSLLFHLLFKIK